MKRACPAASSAVPTNTVNTEHCVPTVSPKASPIVHVNVSALMFPFYPSITLLVSYY